MHQQNSREKFVFKPAKQLIFSQLFQRFAELEKFT